MSTWSTQPVGARTVNLDRRRVPVRRSERKPGPFPYYGASGVVDHVHDYLFDGLHLLVAEDGENLRSRKTPVAFLADGKFWVNNHAHILLANDENDIRYLAYALEGSDVSAYITGSAQPKLNQMALSQIPITAPLVHEQRGIAATLAALDDKISSNAKVVQIALDLLDALSAQVSTELPSTSLGSLVTIVRNTVNPARFGDESVALFSLPAFDDGARPESVPASTVMSNKLEITQPTILLSRLNPRFNRTWWVAGDDRRPNLASTEFTAFTAASRESLAAVWLAVRDEFFRAELARRVTGTSGSHQRVRPADLLTMEVPDVSKVQKETSQLALELLEVVDGRREQMAKLEKLRDALLPELLSGRIRVPEAREAGA
jgi:type I restriction enzyme S subunit